ncbi:hypothetical protein HPB50_021723 [Hyalomma asiaticum]|uniref:Uncharacterized protein n=1 Tax=Hyalomma asiaticum TaxID=266040 RepID=A0ACB7TBE8_HYAAI|nr:hypothetical protein HPB50_021723 [Hyalomma asiaticum]
MAVLWYPAYLVLAAIALAILVKIYSLVTVGKCRSTRDMSGKTVIITGANTGIGKEAARELCRRNARVILACRDVSKAHATAEEIERDTGVRPACMQLDLCSFASIRQFAQHVVAHEDRLDVLINNAGILPPPARRETEDGFEVTFQTNYLGHFLLTNLLLGFVKSDFAHRSTDLYARTVGLVIRLFGKSSMDGAQTSVHLAVSEEVEGISGKVFADCKPSFAPGKMKDA